MFCVEIFKDVIDVNGCFKGDIIGMLNLYEASYHSVEEESILDDAREFTTKYLKETLENVEDQKYSIVHKSCIGFSTSLDGSTGGNKLVY